MEKWEYAIGDQGMTPGYWHIDIEGLPDYEAATRALTRAIMAQQGTDWVNDPQIVKRCDRYPEWQPVKDHAAELLAEATLEVAHEFRRVGQGVVQGNDLYAVFAKLAAQINPNTENPQEFD